MLLFPSLKLGNNEFDSSRFARRCKQRQPQNMAHITSDLQFGSNILENSGSFTQTLSAVYRHSFHRALVQAQHNNGPQIVILGQPHSLIFICHWFNAQLMMLFSRIAFGGNALSAFFKKNRRSSGIRMEQATKYARFVHSDIAGYCSFNSRIKGTA